MKDFNTITLKGEKTAQKLKTEKCYPSQLPPVTENTCVLFLNYEENEYVHLPCLL
jgi:hypothetical protein